jgi:Skp family chaperone for outer membrane proteins
MKKILIALAALSLGIAACNNTENAGNNSAAEPIAVDSLATTGRVAYFYVDKVVAQYNFAQDKQAEFQKKYDAATKKLSSTETAINKDYQKLQQQVVELNEKAQKVLITSADYQKEMERLAGEEQKIQNRIASFQAEMQKVQNELAEEEMVVTNQIMDNVSKYVQQLNANYSYDVIIASTVGSPVFHANPLLDLTDTIIKGLNSAK